MKREEITVQAKLKPNCGLENTRASLVMRRIAPLCDSATCHPHAIKSSRETIPYLRDHGLFVTFVSRTPERVLAAISGAFFVDSCTIVEDPEGIPPFEMPSAPQEDDAENGGIEAISSFADRDARSERDEKLSNLIAQLEETNRSLRAHAESLPTDRVLSDIAFSYAQTLDHLRSTVALSRIEAFDRIAPSLHKLVEDYGRQFGVPVDLELEQGRMDLDRSVLASI
ncbi:MAG: chemotaxis protein CheA, partial [Eggerthella sp.]|nr:chemotaxis protein CheA [Eggerthella sp.]